jgi:hypothetical protein
MTTKRYSLRAQVTTDNSVAVKPVLERLIVQGSVTVGEKEGEFRVQAEMEGSSARDLNRLLLSELRRTEKKTRLRAEWTCEGMTERFFDYVPKGTRSA